MRPSMVSWSPSRFTSIESGLTPGMSARSTNSSAASKMSTAGGKYAPGRVLSSRRSTFCFGLASMSDGDMVLLLPDGPSVALDLDAARPRLLRLGDANGEDPAPELRAGRLTGDPARAAYHTPELAVPARAPAA